jgi:oxalate decarboxylase
MTVFFPADNARTVDFNPNVVGYVPSNAPHYIENTGGHRRDIPGAARQFSRTSPLTNGCGACPRKWSKGHLGLDQASLANIPCEKLVIV